MKKSRHENMKKNWKEKQNDDSIKKRTVKLNE